MGHGVVAFRKMFTREEFEAMPDDWRGELVMGELVMAPPPAAYHQHLLTELSTRVCNHLGAERWRVLVAPVNVNVDVYNVYQPDLIVLPADAERPSLDWEIPTPPWVVEILSPSTARYDRDIKLPRLASKGVQEAWLIDPWAREIAVHRLRDGTVQRYGAGETAQALTVPGFRLALADFF